jgi:Spy/CpxP family protein refolding chaperone
MTKARKILFSFIGLYIFAVLSLAHAQNEPGMDGALPKDHSGQRIQEIFSQLGLTDVQKQELEANKQQHRAQMRIARQEMKTDKEEFQNELMKPQLDMPKINDIHNRIKAVQAQMEDNKLSSILAVRSILTQDQFLKFVNLMHKHKQGT